MGNSTPDKKKNSGVCSYHLLVGNRFCAAAFFLLLSNHLDGTYILAFHRLDSSSRAYCIQVFLMKDTQRSSGPRPETRELMRPWINQSSDVFVTRATDTVLKVLGKSVTSLLKPTLIYNNVGTRHDYARRYRPELNVNAVRRCLGGQQIDRGHWLITTK